MDRRTGGLLCLILAIILLLVGSVTKSWWTASSEVRVGEEVSAGVGLSSIELCVDECELITLKKLLPKKEKAFVTFGAITMYGGFLLSMALVLVLALTASGKATSNVISPARITILLSSIMLLCAIIFVILAPEEFHSGPMELSVGYSLFSYVIGAFFGLLGSTLLSQLPNAAATMANSVMAQGGSRGVPPMAPVAPRAGAVPACPTCGAPTRWVTEHARHLCDKCQVYI